MDGLGISKGSLRNQYIRLDHLDRLTGIVLLQFVITGIKIPNASIDHQDLAATQDVTGRVKSHLNFSYANSLTVGNHLIATLHLSWIPILHKRRRWARTENSLMSRRGVITVSMRDHCPFHWI